MPWSPNSFRSKHNKGLSDAEARRAAKTANAVLKHTGDEGRAVRAGNAAAHKHRKGGSK